MKVASAACRRDRPRASPGERRAQACPVKPTQGMGPAGCAGAGGREDAWHYRKPRALRDARVRPPGCFHHEFQGPALGSGPCWAWARTLPGPCCPYRCAPGLTRCLLQDTGSVPRGHGSPGRGGDAGLSRSSCIDGTQPLSHTDVCGDRMRLAKVRGCCVCRTVSLP